MGKPGKECTVALKLQYASKEQLVRLSELLNGLRVSYLTLLSQTDNPTITGINFSHDQISLRHADALGVVPLIAVCFYNRFLVSFIFN